MPHTTLPSAAVRALQVASSLGCTHAASFAVVDALLAAQSRHPTLTLRQTLDTMPDGWIAWRCRITLDLIRAAQYYATVGWPAGSQGTMVHRVWCRLKDVQIPAGLAD